MNPNGGLTAANSLYVFCMASVWTLYGPCMDKLHANSIQTPYKHYGEPSPFHY